MSNAHNNFVITTHPSSDKFVRKLGSYANLPTAELYAELERTRIGSDPSRVVVSLPDGLVPDGYLTESVYRQIAPTVLVEVDNAPIALGAVEVAKEFARNYVQTAKRGKHGVYDD